MRPVSHYRRRRARPAIQGTPQEKPPGAQLLPSEKTVTVDRLTLTVN